MSLKPGLPSQIPSNHWSQRFSNKDQYGLAKAGPAKYFH
jgi:hypothetical protein